MLAIGTEFIQLIIPGRTFNPVDIYANIAGALVGCILIALANKRN